jgi:homogentisate 1,2-dioxygenase
MPQYLCLGSIPKKRHIEHRVEGGFRNEGIHYEEVITTEGFHRAYSIVYHLRPPTRVLEISPQSAPAIEYSQLDVLRHHHLKTLNILPFGDPITGRIPVMGNRDVVLHRCRPSERSSPLYRNALADEIIFIHRGSGFLNSLYGRLPFKPFDYIVIPRCTTYELEFAQMDGHPDMLVIESTGTVRFPGRYLNPDGQFRLGAPFSERDLHGPHELNTIDREEPVDVLIKDGQRWSKYTLASHPFDAVGWDGLVYPYTFNADDFEPITGTIHQPPPIHQTFQTDGLVVCTFAPRMLDTHPDAVKVPYAHSNVESDEVLYYVRGHFGSRRGVEEGSLTLHPHGIPHGPHPGTIVASRSMKWTDELAVMVDTFRPLRLTKQALELDAPDYPYSWME